MAIDMRHRGKEITIGTPPPPPPSLRTKSRTAVESSTFVGIGYGSVNAGLRLRVGHLPQCRAHGPYRNGPSRELGSNSV